MLLKCCNSVLCCIYQVLCFENHKKYQLDLFSGPRCTYSAIIQLLWLSRTDGSKETVLQIRPSFFTAEMCDRRHQSCNQDCWNFIRNLNWVISFLQHLRRRRNTFSSLHKDEWSSNEFRFPWVSGSRKLRSGISHRRCVMLTIFWSSCGVAHVDFDDKNVP